MISVIIATKNRNEALKSISLPSLLRQESEDFEVILWDASDTDASEKVAQEFFPLFREKGIPFSFTYAPRAGSASQRNDAAACAKGDVLFFIDDDCEVSADGIASLRKGFDENPGCMGGALFLWEEDMEKEKISSRKERWKNTVYHTIGYKRLRKVHPSGSSGGMSAPPGPAEWLSGGSMAFRKQVFEAFSFNEKLESFGGYAVGEDVEFSHKIFLHYGFPLIIFPEGRVRHHPWPGERNPLNEENIAMLFYNRYLLMTLASRRGPLRGRISFGWNILRRFFSLSFRNGLSLTQRGFIMAVKKILADRSEKVRGKKGELER